VIEPGIYFAMNAPLAVLGTTPDAVAQTVNQWGFMLTPDMLTQTAQAVGETSIVARAGGAPTLAVGMAHILHQVIGGQAMMGFWYHFAILFEALFILTAVDAGTRAGRFMLQDLLGTFAPSLKRTESLPANLIATALCVAAWCYFLYQGVVDPLGGINTLWPLFGISNQMLAGIALMLATVVLFKMKRSQFAWVTVIPTVWLLVCTLTAGWQKIFHSDPKISFVTHAQKLSAALAEGKVLAPAKSLEQMQRMIFNDYVDATLCGLFMLVVVSIVIYGVLAIMRARRIDHPTVQETPYQPIAAAV
jgi:carbon starvation protein